ncbi:MAG: Type 1 glutamine amidotransferase-like domain-containing protein [Candidatus Saccharimonadales bacterium]
MKLVLASQGFTTPEIANAVAKLAGKPLDELKVAIINEAYVAIAAGRDESWLINELSLLKQYVKGDTIFVNLRAYDIAEIKERLSSADVIYIVGGAQLVLPKLFKETGFDKLLTELAQDKVVLGTSAGANVVGAHIRSREYWTDQYGDADTYLAKPSLGLVDFNILPHYDREDHPRRNETILTPLLNDNPFPLYGVTDTQAVVYNNGELEFVGGDPVEFGKMVA